MNAFIELESEVLIDQSVIRDPYLRLMAAAVGRQIIRGSSWLTIHKDVAEACLVSDQYSLPSASRSPCPHSRA